LSIVASCLLLLALPYLWALLIAPPGYEYGGLLYNPDDQNVHLSWARQAREGHFFLRDVMTTENLSGSEKPLFNNLFTSAIGVLSLITRLPLVVVYHLLRLIFSALALWWFWLLCRELTPDRRVRLTALALAAFGGGAGWLLPLFPNRIFMDRPDVPNGLMMPEAFTFTSALVFPLMIASVALLALVFLLTLRARANGNLRLAFTAASAAFVLSNIHTYDAIPLFAIMALWALAGFNSQAHHMSTHAPDATSANGQAGEPQMREPQMREPQMREPQMREPQMREPQMREPQMRETQTERARIEQARIEQARWLAPLIVAGGLLPPLIYQVYVFRNSSEFRIKGSTPTPAPALVDVFLSYGPLMMLAMVGAFVVWREGRARLMVVWAIACLILIYAPVSFARKMIEGLHLPLCFLAASGLVALVSRIKMPAARRVSIEKMLIAGAVGVMSVSSLQFVAWCLGNAVDNNRARISVLMPPLYLSSGDAAALRWIASRNTTERDGAILCLPLLGNYAPRETGRNVFVGHWAETLNFQPKLGEMTAFYKNRMNAEQARQWLRDNRIGYVIIGKYEKELGATLPLDLKMLHEEGGTKVYEAPPS